MAVETSSSLRVVVSEGALAVGTLASTVTPAGVCAVEGGVHAENEANSMISGMRQYKWRFWKGIKVMLLSETFSM
jgi:hypothetical protein